MTAAVSAERDPIFVGVPQDGITLGDPAAPATLVEYADLQCPYCATFSRDVLPAVVAQYVRSGRLRLEFRGLAFLGPDSDKALRAALAAGERDRLWDALHALFERQGSENAGWVTDELLAGLKPLGVDLERTSSPWVEQQLDAAEAAARMAAVPGTPYFRVRREGGVAETLPVDSYDPAAFTGEARRPARPVSDRALRAAVLALSLVGAAVAAYVLTARLGDTDLYCVTGGCETVQSSRYSGSSASRWPRSGSSPTSSSPRPCSRATPATSSVRPSYSRAPSSAATCSCSS